MYVAAVSPKNKNKNRCQKLLPRKYIVYQFVCLVYVDVADTARVTLPQLDGNSDYINFCFIDVSSVYHVGQYDVLIVYRVIVKSKHFRLGLDPCNQQPLIFGQ